MAGLWMWKWYPGFGGFEAWDWESAVRSVSEPVIRQAWCWTLLGSEMPKSTREATAATANNLQHCFDPPFLLNLGTANY